MNHWKISHDILEKCSLLSQVLRAGQEQEEHFCSFHLKYSWGLLVINFKWGKNQLTWFLRSPWWRDTKKKPKQKPIQSQKPPCYTNRNAASKGTQILWQPLCSMLLLWLPLSHCIKVNQLQSTTISPFLTCISHPHTGKLGHSASLTYPTAGFWYAKWEWKLWEHKVTACYLLCPDGDCTVALLEHSTSSIIPEDKASAHTHRGPFRPHLYLLPVL